MSNSGSDHWRIDGPGESIRMMKPTTTVLKRVSAILLMMLTAAVI